MQVPYSVVLPPSQAVTVNFSVRKFWASRYLLLSKLCRSCRQQQHNLGKVTSFKKVLSLSRFLLQQTFAVILGYLAFSRDW